MTKPRLKYLHLATTRHGKPVVYFRRPKGPRIRLPDDLTSKVFMDAYHAAFAGKPIVHVRDMPKTKAVMRRGRTKNYLVSGLRNARTRARKKNLPFDLTLEYLFGLAESQDYRCALTGIEFFANCGATCRVSPYVPSIDRVTPKGGYTMGNVRLIAFALNAMLLDWGEDTFKQVANSYRYWGAKKERPIPSPARTSPSPEKTSVQFNGLQVVKT